MTKLLFHPEVKETDFFFQYVLCMERYRTNNLLESEEFCNQTLRKYFQINGPAQLHNMQTALNLCLKTHSKKKSSQCWILNKWRRPGRI